jgi:hypothetical protein
MWTGMVALDQKVDVIQWQEDVFARGDTTLVRKVVAAGRTDTAHYSS